MLTYLPFERAKRQVEAGDFSFEAIGALTIAHGEKLIRDYDALDRRGCVETLEPTLFAHRGAGMAVMLTWDRAGLQHVATVFDYRTVGRTYEASDGWESKPRVIDWSTFGAGPEAA